MARAAAAFATTCILFRPLGRAPPSITSPPPTSPTASRRCFVRGTGVVQHFASACCDLVARTRGDPLQLTSNTALDRLFVICPCVHPSVHAPTCEEHACSEPCLLTHTTGRSGHEDPFHGRRIGSIFPILHVEKHVCMQADEHRCSGLSLESRFPGNRHGRWQAAEAAPRHLV
jgi:hypothetical protein